MKYLYGLSIQGIQSYIFETSKLKEVIGASELISSLPEKIVQEIGGIQLKDENLLINAAGNFKYIFDDQEICKRIFKQVPFEFSRMAGDITVSQCVIPFQGEEPEKKDIDELEKNLRAQRNRNTSVQGLGLMSAKKVAITGNPEMAGTEKGLDLNQALKRNAVDSGKQGLLEILVDNPMEHSFTNNLEEITDDKYGNWIAVIHADGNNLGKKILNMAQKLVAVKNGFNEMSKRLDRATKKAVRTAFQKSVLGKTTEENFIPFRPVIVGGDDVTVITRGDLALEFTESFLVEFEKETKVAFADFDERFLKGEKLFKGGLSACAGIAYIKSHYPFHYGVQLADNLCKEAKKVSKSLNKVPVPPSLMFHKMHSSFVRDWEEIKKAELKAGDVSFVNGPYFLEPADQYTSIQTLKGWASELARPTAPKSNIRQWLALLEDNQHRAVDLMKRTRQVLRAKDMWKNLALDRSISVNGEKKTHLFDVLTISDIQSTK